jgi:hypothetical protein
MHYILSLLIFILFTPVSVFGQTSTLGAPKETVKPAKVVAFATESGSIASSSVQMARGMDQLTMLMSRIDAALFRLNMIDARIQKRYETLIATGIKNTKLTKGLAIFTANTKKLQEAYVQLQKDAIIFEKSENPAQDYAPFRASLTLVSDDLQLVAVSEKTLLDLIKTFIKPTVTLKPSPTVRPSVTPRPTITAKPTVTPKVSITPIK